MGRNEQLGIERGWRMFGGIVALSGALALAGCGGEKDAGTGPPPRAEGVTLTFDYLGGGSPIIEVYPGVEDTKADRIPNGTFNDGDTVPAECKTEGRTVKSDPSVGEEPRTSDDWIRIHGSPGKRQYATAVYVKNPEQLLSQLPDC